MEKLEKGETAESSSSGIGMANVHQRLKLIYGDKSSISFRNRTAGGVKVGESSARERLVVEVDATAGKVTFLL